VAGRASIEYDGAVSQLEIVAVHDDATAKAWHVVDDATRTGDVPADPLSEVLPRVTQPRGTGERTELYLGLVEGQPVAIGELMLPVLDNSANATAEVRVLEEHRRRGYGTQMLTHLLSRAREEGRRRIFGEVVEPLEGNEVPAGVAFAKAHGARPVLFEIRRVLRLDSLDAQRLAELGDQARERADGYSLVQWADRAPDDIVDDLAVLKGRMSVDAPHEDMEWEAENYDAERVRALEATIAARRRRVVATAARHDATGRLVGYTDIGVNIDRPRVAYQWDTIVLTEHRGHRLGLLMKLANVELLRRTIDGVEIVNTWNAAVNEHMIAVNEAIGFRPAERERQWELDV
jgi:GNAT superfamily N-acetyltransferase